MAGERAIAQKSADAGSVTPRIGEYNMCETSFGGFNLLRMFDSLSLVAFQLQFPVVFSETLD